MAERKLFALLCPPVYGVEHRARALSNAIVLANGRVAPARRRCCPSRILNSNSKSNLNSLTQFSCNFGCLVQCCENFESEQNNARPAASLPLVRRTNGKLAQIHLTHARLVSSRIQNSNSIRAATGVYLPVCLCEKHRKDNNKQACRANSIARRIRIQLPADLFCWLQNYMAAQEFSALLAPKWVARERELFTWRQAIDDLCIHIRTLLFVGHCFLVQLTESLSPSPHRNLSRNFRRPATCE